jgi:hypothetical protein
MDSLQERQESHLEVDLQLVHGLSPGDKACGLSGRVLLLPSGPHFEVLKAKKHNLFKDSPNSKKARVVCCFGLLEHVLGGTLS